MHVSGNELFEAKARESVRAQTSRLTTKDCGKILPRHALKRSRGRSYNRRQILGFDP